MKKLPLLIVLVIIVGAIVYLESLKPKVANRSGAVATTSAAPAITTTATGQDRTATIQKKSSRYELAPEVSSPNGFINTDRISVGGLRGKKVILVDFWTYSCINCQRTIPYLNAWYEKYKDKGLEIIGVHTPEFQFEQDKNNVAQAVKKFGITYPVVLDNDYSTWTAYGNRYWPHEYLIDIDGFIVHDHIGEGGYDETEKSIQAALEERMAVFGGKDHISGATTTPAGAEEPQAQSPETYFGADRNVYLGNGASFKKGLQQLNAPQQIALNQLYLVGTWDFTGEYARNESAGAKAIFRYNAKNVYMVVSASKPMTAKLVLDGKPYGTVTFNGDQLYALVRDPSGAGEHTLEVIIEKPGLKAFTFTFG